MLHIPQGDVRIIPRYTLAEASRYLWINPVTLRSWARGRFYETSGQRRHAKPLLGPSDRSALSFLNLTEGHVLAALRQTHCVRMSKIRAAVAWLKQQFKTDYPLLHPELATDGLDVFVRELGRLISASEHGQEVMREVIERYLSRIERDKNGVPIEFYPFTRGPDALETPKLIVINPEIAFGRPVISGTRVFASTIIERFKAGDNPNSLAEDYGIQLDAVHEAIRSQYEAAA